MRSIRLSLLLYFLLLLAASLGAVSWLVYRNTAAVLAGKEEARRELLRAQHDRAAQREEAKLDDALYLQARTLGGQAQFQWQGGRQRHLLLVPLGLLNTGLDPNGTLLLPIWLMERGHNPTFDYMMWTLPAEIQFNEEVLPRYADGQVAEYFQINTEAGKAWRSSSLGENSLPYSRTAFESAQLLDPRFDELELRPGVIVRRVTLKAPVARTKFFPPTRPRFERFSRSASSSPPPPPSRPPEPREMQSPAIYIQCAAETERRDAALAALREGLEQDLANLSAESQATLSLLRTRLLLIGGLTFAATTLGGIWLVRLGLSPLRRLSDAVSQISTKDFRLPFEDRRLPHELRPIVERLNRTLELLKRAFAREKKATADISHELRTPMAALMTTVEVALRKPRTPEEYREVLHDCREAGQQMTQLVERLLALARLDAGFDTLRPQIVDAAALAEQCATLVQPLADARGLTVQLHRNGPLPVRLDPDKFREIVTNLLHNAIEYNQPAGRVDLTIQQENNHLEVAVADTGIGMPPEVREHIFERFYRADASRHADGLHAGLGLSIVKEYVDLMGGSLSVESSPGQGSTFQLQLPMATTPPNPPADRAPREGVLLGT